MKVHHLRNATFVIESGAHHILVDPMLSPKGALPPFAWFRHTARRNPVVDLPANAASVLDRVTLCLVTHSQKWGIDALTHTDHFDSVGMQFLRDNEIPVVCREQDAAWMRKKGMRVAAAISTWNSTDLLGGRITAVPARHGHSWVAGLMANGAGLFLELPEEPSLYIAGDTVCTEEVERALSGLKPDIAVVAAGSASLDVGGPILMPMEEILRFVKKAPNKVVANHLEALNHCPTTRAALRQALEDIGLLGKTMIPEDGETLTFA
jgi:L-ascorbate metabolism protein UlaG (beta-lactamase superfamily)